MAEKHSIENLGELPSDFLRVELKGVALKLDEPFRGKAQASLAASADTVEFDQQGVKVERIVCVGAEACEVKAESGGSLVVAITPFGLMQGGARREELVKAGDVKWVSGEGITVKAEEGGAAHLLRIVMAGAK